MRKVREILRLARGEGLALRQVGAALGVPFTTVGDHLRRAERAGLSWPLPDGLDDVALERLLFPKGPAPEPDRPLPDWRYVHRELKRKGVTLMLLWHEYREGHPDGYSYSQFCLHYRAFQRHLDLPMRQEHQAGEKLFVDFPGELLAIYDRRTGQVAFEAELFVAVLGASNYLYAEAVRSQGLEYWVNAHVHAFEAFGSVPRIVVCDNLRSGVARAHRYEPDVNATYEEMAAHHGVAIIPARPGKPRDKAKVEAGVLLAERWILARLRNRRFYSLAEANAAIADCVAAINDRPFRKMPGSRRSWFEELERPAMRPLPENRYEFARWRVGLKVNIDYHIESNRHYYSVPYQLVGARVDVRVTVSTVEVFHASRRVASHLRDDTPGRHSTDPAHMPESHRRHAPVEPQPHHRLGRADRTVNGRPGGSHLGVEAASRAGLSELSGHHPPGRPLRARTGGGRGCPRPERARPVVSLGRVDPASRPRLPAPPGRAGPHPPASPEPARRRLLPMKGTDMLTNTTLEGLQTLRLPGMMRGLLEQREHPDYAALGFEERLAMLVDRELTERRNRKLERVLKAARLRSPATVEGIDFRRHRGLERAQVLSLAESHWVEAHHSVVIVGATGLGKTYLACALANAAIRRGHTAIYLRGPRLLDDIAIARAEGRLVRLLASWARVDILVIDDFLIRPLSPDQAADMLEVIEDRVQLRATIVTSQLPVAMWHEALGEPTVADGILDRLLQNVHRIELHGESMRRSALDDSDTASSQPAATPNPAGPHRTPKGS